MNTPAHIQSGARRDSHRHYTRELKSLVDEVALLQGSLVDVVDDLTREQFYTAPESKGMLRDAVMGLGAIRRTVEAALRELPAP